jgi:hypothetical protein
MCVYIYIHIYTEFSSVSFHHIVQIFFFFGDTGVWIQGLTLDREALYNPVHIIFKTTFNSL